MPFGKQRFTITLLENDDRQNAVEHIIEHSTGNNNVFSDLSYELILNREDLSLIKDVRLYVNDTYEPSTFSNGHICFPAKGENNRRIFQDCYGFVEICIVLTFEDGSESTLTSEYLPVLVRKGELNESVKAMVSYVYTHQEVLLLNGEPKPRDLAGLKNSGYKSLAAQIILAEEIAAIYEDSYGYFKTNSRFIIEKVATVERLDKLQNISPETLQYIASHPEQLKPVNSTSGVRMGNRIYHPEKTLSLQNVNSYDIYENRVILGFLRRMVDEVELLREHCLKLMTQIPNNEVYSQEYIYSSFFMFAETHRMLKIGLQKLTILYDKFTQLWRMYYSIFSIHFDQLISKPAPSAIFMSVPQYNKVFIRIHQWFNFGLYDFSKEHFMLSFVKISALYESYLLAKLINYFIDRGYEAIESKRCVYPATSPKWKYKNTKCLNTFKFSNGSKTITLYYQPVIYDTDRSNINGVGLYRNNSIPVLTGENDDNRKGGRYYAPDYIIMVENGDSKKYLILDAKFSDADNVRLHYIKDLAFKYLFSVSPISTVDSVDGMAIIYGKCTERDIFQSAYDNQIVGGRIVPLANILPLIEGIAQKDQYTKLDLLFKEYVS